MFQDSFWGILTDSKIYIFDILCIIKLSTEALKSVMLIYFLPMLIGVFLLLKVGKDGHVMLYLEALYVGTYMAGSQTIYFTFLLGYFSGFEENELPFI